MYKDNYQLYYIIQFVTNICKEFKLTLKLDI